MLLLAKHHDNYSILTRQVVSKFSTLTIGGTFSLFTLTGAIKGNGLLHSDEDVETTANL